MVFVNARKLCFFLAILPEVSTLGCIRLCEEVIYESNPNVVAHLVELLVYFFRRLQVQKQMPHQCTIR